MTQKCTKEAELAELQTDMKWIKENLKTITPKITNMHDTFTKGDGKISTLNKEVFGNGKPSLKQQITEIEKKFSKWGGAVSAILFIVQILIAVAVFIN